ncbi:zeta toxin family protein [Cellulomonas sp. C5510]|uniref:zeta toxin family protein n=1 Tax=Cellulomonas sp. C5510 TaxID=2871170 RepID=UPI001C94AB7C|nr:zeta toxin family protein [Cellulomonas sp. C5510]QZN87739.1 zeta toxin family protein [Cellulomonas sp. C5510]
MSRPDDLAVSRHRDLVRELSRPGGPLAADGPNATVNNPAWFRTPNQPRGARGELHDRLVDAHRERFADVLADKQAIVLAGPPGAGKSTVQRAILGDRAGEWLVVDADEFKHALLRTALEDGSYRNFLVPDRVRELEADGERFAPLELASLVHEESSLLARQLRAEAIADGLNIVVDTVLSSERAALSLGADLEAAGYRVRVVDVETTYEISAARVEQRWRNVTREFLADERATGLGGRWVPSEYTRALFPPELAGTSVCEGVARTLAEQCPAVSRLEVYRVVDPTQAPYLEVVLERGARRGALVDASAARAAAIADVSRARPGRRSDPAVER